jgi:hypothetical protein
MDGTMPLLEIEGLSAEVHGHAAPEPLVCEIGRAIVASAEEAL